MTFQPEVNQELNIDGTVYTVVEHPAARGMPYGQEGRQAVVYALVGKSSGEKRALKAFKSRFRVPAMVGLAKRLAFFADLPGLQVCRRSVLTPMHHATLLREYPDLLYAVVMPWVDGPTWMEIVGSGQVLTVEQSLLIARSMATVLAGMEQEGLAHCDLSGPNILLPVLARPDENGAGKAASSPVALVDVEQMFGPDLKRPEVVPGGSPGYAHKMAPEGMWETDADRLSGAVLLAEMLGWCDDRLRAQSWGESYFEPTEMQTESERYDTLMRVLVERWGDGVAQVFDRAWHSDTLSDCPTFGEWLVVLPDSVATAAGRPVVSPGTRAPLPLEAGPVDPIVRDLTDQAQEVRGQGDVKGALALYREARSLTVEGSRLSNQLTEMIQDLEREQNGVGAATADGSVAAAAEEEEAPIDALAKDLVSQASQLEDDGDLSGALATYREARSILPARSRLGRELALIITDLELRVKEETPAPGETAVQPPPIEAAPEPPVDPMVADLMSQARELEESGDLTGAQATYREARSVAPRGGRLASELDVLIAALAKRISDASKAPAVAVEPQPEPARPGPVAAVVVPDEPSTAPLYLTFSPVAEPEPKAAVEAEAQPQFPTFTPGVQAEPEQSEQQFATFTPETQAESQPQFATFTPEASAAATEASEQAFPSFRPEDLASAPGAQVGPEAGGAAVESGLDWEGADARQAGPDAVPAGVAAATEEGPPVAVAVDPLAFRLVVEGQKAEEAGDVNEALSSYRKAQALVPPDGDLGKDLAKAVVRLESFLRAQAGQDVDLGAQYQQAAEAPGAQAPAAQVPLVPQPMEQAPIQASAVGIAETAPVEAPAEHDLGSMLSQLPEQQYPEQPSEWMPPPDTGSHVATGAAAGAIYGGSQEAVQDVAAAGSGVSGAALDTYYDMGLAAYNRGDWAQAGSLLREVVKRQPAYQRDGQYASSLLSEVDRRTQGKGKSSKEKGDGKSRKQASATGGAVTAGAVTGGAASAAQGSPATSTRERATATSGLPSWAIPVAIAAGVVLLLAVLAFVLLGNMGSGNSLADQIKAVKLARTLGEGTPGAQHTDDVRAVAFSRDGKTLTTGSWDRTVRLWNAADWSLTTVLTAPDAVLNLDVSPDGKYIAAATDPKEGEEGGVWMLTPGDPGAAPVKVPHPGRVWGVAFSPDGKYLATSSGIGGPVSGTVRLWNVLDITPSGSPTGETSAASTAASSATPVNEVIIKDDSGNPVGYLRSLAFSPDGKTLAIAASDGTVRLWNPFEQEQDRGMKTLKGHEGAVLTVAFSPDGKMLASSGIDRTVRLWSLPSGEPIGTPLPPPTFTPTETGPPPTPVPVSTPGGPTATTVPTLEPARIAEIAQTQGKSGHSAQVNSVVFSPDGKVLASTGYDGVIRLWSAADGTLLGVLVEPSLKGFGLSFSPDGKYLASTSGLRNLDDIYHEGKVRIWDWNVK